MARFSLRPLRPLVLALAFAVALAPVAASAKTRTHHRRHATRHARHHVHRHAHQARAKTTAPRAQAAVVCTTGVDTSAVGAPLSTLRSAVVCLINQQRELHHLPALRASSQLDRSAQGWSNTMVRTGQFTHGADFTVRIDSVGYDWSNAGENIAAGFTTPRAVVAAWMASLDHCQNILSPNFADVGTGVNASPLGSYGPATWTQDFGLWMGHRVPSRNTAPARGCPYRVS